MYSSYEETQVPLFTECHFIMPISAIARCNLHSGDSQRIFYYKNYFM